jgi:hypothetical protein
MINSLNKFYNVISSNNMTEREIYFIIKQITIIIIIIILVN